jgi:hypothetical protein
MKTSVMLAAGLVVMVGVLSSLQPAAAIIEYSHITR